MRRALVVASLALVAVGAPEPPRIRGVVLDPLGRPLQGATVTLETPRSCCVLEPGQSFRSAVTDEEGRFMLDAPAFGPMQLRATHPAGAPSTTVAADGAILRLGTPRRVEGFVPVEAEVYVTRGLERLATARARGAFRLERLPEGEELTLHVVSPRHRPYQRRLVVGEAMGKPGIDLDEGLALRGSVRPPRAGVVLRASQGEARESLAETDRTGAFVLTGLRSGAVCVVVLDGEDEPQVLFTEAGGHLDVELFR